jgi:diaminopropionate ammonia-lyase
MQASFRGIADPALRDGIGLDQRSNVLLFGTEGATDADLYHKLLNSDGAMLTVSHSGAS